MRKLLAILLLLPVAVGAACTPASGYSYAEAVTIAAPAATLTSHPQMFYTGGSNLSSLASALVANARSDGYDIIFRTEDPPSTIAHTRLAYDNSTGYWFGYLGPLTRSTATTVCVNYGNSGASDTSSATPLAALEVVVGCNASTDWTGNSHAAVPIGTPGSASGPTCPAWTLDETVPSYLSLTDTGDTGEIDSTTTFRMSILVNADAATTELDSERLVWRNVTTTSQRWPIMIWGESGGSDNGTIGKQGTPINTFGPLSGGSWHWITVVYDDAVADNSRAWVDGVLVDTDSPAFALSTPTGNITIGFPTGSLSWSGKVGLFMMGLTTAGDSAAWQEAEALALLDPDSVFSLPAAATPPLMPLGSMRLMRLASSSPQSIVTTCVGDEYQAGGFCDVFGADLGHLMGSDR